MVHGCTHMANHIKLYTLKMNHLLHVSYIFITLFLLLCDSCLISLAKLNMLQTRNVWYVRSALQKSDEISLLLAGILLCWDIWSLSLGTPILSPSPVVHQDNITSCVSCFRVLWLLLSNRGKEMTRANLPFLSVSNTTPTVKIQKRLTPEHTT